MKTINLLKQGRGQINPRLLIGVAAAGLIVIAAIWLVTRDSEPEPEPVPAPMPERPLETVEPAQSAVQRGDTAREIIDELEAGSDDVDYAAAYERATEFRADDRYADAQILYFFAARGGHAPAAFDLGTIYDPRHFSADDNLAEVPDPFQAYRWYRVAADAGHETAAGRLDELRAWAEQAAEEGDTAAERLLLQWED